MSKAQHTPGPWRVLEGKYHMQVHSERFWIANIKCESCPDHEVPNAHLIAAAPEMYELVKLVNDSFGGGRLVTFSDEDIAEFNRVIAKAEGHSND